MSSVSNSIPRHGLRYLALGGASLLAVAVAAATPAHAVEFRNGELTGSFDTTLSIGSSFRVADSDPKNLGIPDANGTASGSYTGARYSLNGDDGNYNYDKGLISLAASGTSELALNYKNIGSFVRFNYFYDVENQNDDTDNPNPTKRTLSESAESRIGSDVTLLDAYVYTELKPFDKNVKLRLGNQVLSWGESTFIQNGINVINPVNVSKLRIPGTELRDALLPQPIFDANVSITDNLSLEAFYQFKWNETEIDPVGTYFSTEDFAGKGGNSVFLGFGNPGNAAFQNGTAIPAANGIADNAAVLIQQDGAALTSAGFSSAGVVVPRGPDGEPSDRGQYGFAARYFSPDLNNTEFGGYFINYHSRTPIISGTTGTLQGLVNGATPGAAPAGQPQNYAASARYNVEYPEDIKLYGLSFNTQLPTGTALQGELTYRKDQPLQVDDVELLVAALSPAIAAGAATSCTNLGNPGGAVACQANILANVNSNQIVRDLGAIPGFGQYLSGARYHDVWQGQATATQSFGPIPKLGVDQWVLLGEFGLTHVADLPSKSTLLYEGPNTPAPGTVASCQVANSFFNLTAGGGSNPAICSGLPSFAVPQEVDGFADATSYGYRLAVRFDMLDAVNGVNLFPSLSFQHDIGGTTPLPLGNFIEDRAGVTAGLRATYQNDWAAEIQYSNFFSIGNGQYNQLTDRDLISVNVKYSF